MDTQTYILSGKLEHYLLGLLDEAERREVEGMVEQYPEVRAALHDLEDALATYASAQAQPLSPGFTDRLMQRIDQPGAGAGSSPLPPGPTAAPRSYLGWIAAAMGVAALAFGAWGWSQYQALQTQLTTTQDELSLLRADCETRTRELQELYRQLLPLGDPTTRPIAFDVTDKAPGAAIAVHYNARQGRAFLSAEALPTPAPGKQYQLWAIVDGQPMDLGVFDLTDGSAAFKEIPFVPNAQAFAITLEPVGGLPAPTLEQLHGIGYL